MSGTVVQAVVRRGLVWLARRGKSVSKHVGKHTRNLISAARNRPWILERTVHGVFRTPNPKKLIQRALEAFDSAVVQNNGRVRVVRVFESAIGRNGERALVVILRANGAIITAYPAHVAEAMASSFAVFVLEDKIVEALEGLERLSEQHEARKAAADAHESFVVKLLDFFLFDSTPANEDEDLYIAQDRFHRMMREQYLGLEMEMAQRSFGPEEVAASRKRFDDGLGGAAAAYLELEGAEG